MGVQIHTHTRVLGIDTEGEGLRRRVTRVRTDKGDIECELVVDCGGMFAAEIARMVGVRVPIVPMSHQYVVTEAMFEHRETPLPSLRDPDNLVYYRQEVDGLVMGGYERQSLPWTASASSYDADPGRLQRPAAAPDHDRFVEISENAAIRVPAIADVGIRTFINGPEGVHARQRVLPRPDRRRRASSSRRGSARTASRARAASARSWPSGCSRARRRWTCGTWTSAGSAQSYRSPSYTLARTVENYESYYDIRYPAHERDGRAAAAHVAGVRLARGARRVVRREVGLGAGQPLRDATPTSSDEAWRPGGWAGRHWSPAVVRRAPRARARRAAIFDESSFAKIEVSGPDAARLLQWVCDNDVARGAGSVTYTQALNARGGIECDFTVTQLDAQLFLVVTGTAFGNHDAVVAAHAGAGSRRRRAHRRRHGRLGLLRALGAEGARRRSRR